MNVKQLFDLTGKVILVTGGAGNYGKCMAEGLFNNQPESFL